MAGLNRSQQEVVGRMAWELSDGKTKGYRRSTDGQYMEIRPRTIHDTDAVSDACDEVFNKLGITAVAVDPEIYDATAR